MAQSTAPSPPNSQSIASSHQRIAIVYRPIADLKPDPHNPRQHSKKQIRQIARSIEAFGFNVPVLVDAHSQVVAGHGRILACQELGITEVPTICLDHLTEAQAKAFLIADNRLTENATWDDQLLAQQFKMLSEVELDFSIDVTGFEMAEIDLFIEGLSPVAEGKPDPADELPEPLPVQVSRSGDVWQLGLHRVLCGNACDETAFQILMNGKQASVVFIDPPYNVPIEGHVSGLGEIKHREFVMGCGEMTEVEFIAFLMKVCTHLTYWSVDGSLHFVCMDWRHAYELLSAGRQVYSELKNICVWAKDNGGMGSLYRSQHELVFVFKHGTAAHQNHVQLGQFGRYRTNVWNYAGVNSFARQGEEGNLLALHPTVKPVALVADAILDCSRRGEIVLDAFLGSGTTVIAAERTGRICYGLELDSLYVDTIVRRWQRFTGEPAHQAATGRCFDELAAEAAAAGGRHE